MTTTIFFPLYIIHSESRRILPKRIKDGNEKAKQGRAALNKSAFAPSIKHLLKLAAARILYKFSGCGVYMLKP
jgi:hypothetical protein